MATTTKDNDDLPEPKVGLSRAEKSHVKGAARPRAVVVYEIVRTEGESERAGVPLFTAGGNRNSTGPRTAGHESELPFQAGLPDVQRLCRVTVQENANGHP